MFLRILFQELLSAVSAFEPDATSDSATLDADDDLPRCSPWGASAVSAFEPDASSDSATLWLVSLDVITGILGTDSLLSSAMLFHFFVVVGFDTRETRPPSTDRKPIFLAP